MNPTEANLKLAIAYGDPTAFGRRRAPARATIESVEQHLEMMKRAIAYDAACKDESYFHVFDDMVSDLRSCRERLGNIIKASPATTNQ